MVISLRKFENFEMFCPLGAIYFFLSQGSRVSVEMGTKSEKVCMGH